MGEEGNEIYQNLLENQGVSPELAQKLAQKLAHEDDLDRPETSLADSESFEIETKKPQDSLGFDTVCQLLAEAGFSLGMGEEGLEPPTSTL